MNRVVLGKGRDRSVRRHHPWIFSGAVASASPDLAFGETVAVAAADGETLGYGVWSPASQIRVRMLSFDPAHEPDAAFVAALVSASVARRADVFAQGATDAVRVVNAESDGLPGLVADVYAGHVVCQFTSALAEAWRETVVAALRASVPGCRGVSERRDNDSRAKEGLPVEPAFVPLAGEEPPSEIEISENGIRFLVDVRTGHKTGFYLDQREARRVVGSFARGREVLNCFCYTGGFGLAARANGAAKVTQVDISEDALALAKRNEALTFGGEPQMEYVAADVFKFLRSCRDAGRTFDLVVLDPPKFAATKGQLMKAARGYKDINLLAMKLLRPGGLLATFSCSGAMDAPFFEQILAEAATDAKRDFQIVARTRADADHPVSLAFPEGGYLKGVVLRRT